MEAQGLPCCGLVVLVWWPAGCCPDGGVPVVSGGCWRRSAVYGRGEKGERVAAFVEEKKRKSVGFFRRRKEKKGDGRLLVVVEK